MPIYDDPEFGSVRVHVSALARSARLKVTADGKLVASLPPRAPANTVKKLIDGSRPSIRSILESIPKQSARYNDGMRIGQTRHVSFKQLGGNNHRASAVRVVTTQAAVTVYVPMGQDNASADVQTAISREAHKILRKEASDILPGRVVYFSDIYGFTTTGLRFNNASSRWGSCSSRGSLNFNIALMNLPMDLVDYVVVHELAHTRQMNHSEAFWDVVEAVLPDYKSRRKLLKKCSPTI